MGAGRKPCKLGANCPYQDPHVHHQHLMEFSHEAAGKKGTGDGGGGKGAAAAAGGGPQPFAGTAHTLSGKSSSTASGYRLGSEAGLAAAQAPRRGGSGLAPKPQRRLPPKAAAAAAALARHGAGTGGAGGAGGAAGGGGSRGGAEADASPARRKRRRSAGAAPADAEVIVLD